MVKRTANTRGENFISVFPLSTALENTQRRPNEIDKTPTDNNPRTYGNPTEVRSTDILVAEATTLSLNYSQICLIVKKELRLDAKDCRASGHVGFAGFLVPDIAR